MVCFGIFGFYNGLGGFAYGMFALFIKLLRKMRLYRCFSYLYLETLYAHRNQLGKYRDNTSCSLFHQSRLERLHCSKALAFFNDSNGK
jgi:hypothetical protein